MLVLNGLSEVLFGRRRNRERATEGAVSGALGCVANEGD
jgi:hypothetical protein